MKKIIAALLLIFSYAPAHADEVMNLFPKGRAAYQQDFDKAADRYQVRAQAYNDDVYMYGGERNLSDDTSILSHEDMAGIESTPDSILSDPGNSQLLSEDAYSEPPASPAQ